MAIAFLNELVGTKGLVRIGVVSLTLVGLKYFVERDSSKSGNPPREVSNGIREEDQNFSSSSPADVNKPDTILWEFETGGDVTSSPAIGSDGTVYVGSFDKKLYAINGKSGIKLWEFETGDKVFSSPAIGSDGTVYVGSDDNKLYAIKTESLGLAKSPWPMRGQNPQHTGRVPGAKAPVAMPLGKDFAWSVGVNQQSLDRFYQGKPQTQVRKTFGQPDKTQGNWWGYTGMNITDASGNKYDTAWFGFANGVVKQMRFDK
jgi:hypothetical protein